MIRTFVYDKGLVGGSQPQLLKELMGELGGYDSNSIKVMHFVIPQQLSASNVSRSSMTKDSSVEASHSF
jgi:hypothetical protein